LISRCVRAGRDKLLENIRDILSGFGRVSRALTPEEEAGKRLENWIHESRSRWEALVARELSNEKPSRYSHGIWTVAYSVAGDFKPPTLSDFYEILKKVRGHETGWPPWEIFTRKELAPYSYDGTIECWLKETRFGDAAHSDFWRASPRGDMFLLRGYQEDSRSDEVKPGTIFGLTLPIWRVGECLLHAERLTRALSAQSMPVIFRVIWEGLSGRTLVAWAKSRLGGPDLSDARQSRQNSATSAITVYSDRISATLLEIVNTLTIPLYEAFDFFKLDLKIVQEELSKMRGA